MKGNILSLLQRMPHQSSPSNHGPWLWERRYGDLLSHIEERGERTRRSNPAPRASERRLEGLDCHPLQYATTMQNIFETQITFLSPHDETRAIKMYSLKWVLMQK